jgi:predicted CXXCH cytochrome family protein
MRRFKNNMHIKKLSVCGIRCIPSILFSSLILFPLLVYAGIANTKHDLSVSGPGPIKASSETRKCIFCHTPHNASPAQPLWNHQLSAVVNYENYWSPTLQSYGSAAEAPPIDGYSQLCLSCHDGTVGIGALVGGRVAFAGDYPSPIKSGGTLPQTLKEGDTGYIGIDLSGGHPISIIFDQALATQRNKNEDLNKLKWPITDRDVRLYPTHGGFGVQCPSCHDPCGVNAGQPYMLRKPTADEVCAVCHDNVDNPGFKF